MHNQPFIFRQLFQRQDGVKQFNVKKHAPEASHDGYRHQKLGPPLLHGTDTEHTPEPGGLNARLRHAPLFA
ncbi:hypothetical protein [Aeromonas caviae]|uniref:hypothetical protein n=1 Tax=Aeromonas caviae TaxID=648 RepID=UPI0029DB9CEE|nr:hypothetical protein [Aeromonas caviae]MDX7853380.1 hypothetical protein [Aeromonas caviae]